MDGRKKQWPSAQLTGAMKTAEFLFIRQNQETVFCGSGKYSWPETNDKRNSDSGNTILIMTTITLLSFFETWRRKSLFWPLKLASAIIANRMQQLPGELIVEPSAKLTGDGSSCDSDKDQNLHPDTLIAWLDSRPVPPVNIHFAGSKSDPLASPHIHFLAFLAFTKSSMVSVSTIGLGMNDDHMCIPVDRWVVTTPAATEKSWKKLRKTDRFSEFKTTVEKLVRKRNSTVELVLTIWKESAEDIEPFRKLAMELNVHLATAVFGRYQPGEKRQPETEMKESPYMLDEKGSIKLKKQELCPMQNTLFLDSSGALHPCVFTADTGPGLTAPCEASWRMAASWTRFKQERKFPMCSHCFVSQ